MAKFLTIHELSDQLGLSDTWIKKQAKAGKLPHVRDGNQMRFPAAEAVKAACELATHKNDDKRKEVTNA